MIEVIRPTRQQYVKSIAKNGPQNERAATISYEVADILNRLNDALKSLNFDDVQEQLGEGDLMGALEAVLSEVFPDGEFLVNSDAEQISVALGGGYVLTFQWATSENQFLNSKTWGHCVSSGDNGSVIYLNKDLIKKAGDLFCVLSHELTHAYLSKEFSSQDIKKMLGTNQIEEVHIFHEAVAYTIEMRMMLQVGDEYLSPDFKDHVLKKYAQAFMYYRHSPAYEK